MKNNVTELICPNCSTAGTTRIQKRICINENSDQKQAILTGSFFEWECPCCKDRFFIKSPFLYNDDEHKFMVYYIPEFKERAHKIPTLLQTKKEYDTQNSKLRIAVTFVDFIEKIRILEADLDDAIVETIKSLYSKVNDQEGGEKIFSMVLEKKDTDDNLHFGVFLKEKDFTVTVPKQVYDQAYEDFSTILANSSDGEFIIVDQVWLAQVLGESKQ